MGFTLAQKLLKANATGEVKPEGLSPGAIVNCKVSMVLVNDITAPLAIKSFRSMGAAKVFDKDRVAMVMDHFTPQKDIESAEQVMVSRAFAQEQNITHYYEGGDAGVEHALLPEQGLVGPWDVVIGADSHTCTYGGIGAFATGVGSTDAAGAMALGEIWLRVPSTIRVEFSGKLPEYVSGKDLILWTIGQLGVDGARYKALEFGGQTIDDLSVEGRLTMANMAIEAGGKCGLFSADAKTIKYCTEAGFKNPKEIAPDADAEYEQVLKHDVSNMSPIVACPHLPENTCAIEDAPKKAVNQVIIGSCTNGRIEDMRAAAAVLKGRKVQRGLRCIVLPATPTIWKQALKEGLIETFMESGCIVGPASCGPCLGGHLGILGAGEVSVATTNRNFKGRMGSLQSEVYLVNPAVAAATAIAGEMLHPGKL